MKTNQTVKMTWGTYKGETGIITEANGKNITVKLDQGFEIEVSTDHVEEVKAETTHTLNLTEKEEMVINVIAENMNGYADGFCDIDIDDIVSETGLTNKTTKGVLGSLNKKGYINQETNGESNIYTIIGEAEMLLDF